MANFIICGAYDAGTGYSDIYADTLTGEVILDSDLLGKVFLGELNVLDPIPVADGVVAKLCDYFNCDGVILSHRHLITLKGTVASYRNYGNNEVIEHTVTFDTDLTADVELE